MKQHLLRALRNLRLLEFADRAHRRVRQIQGWRESRRFASAHPDYPVPPAKLAFEAYGHCSPEEYRRTGLAHARLIATLIRDHARSSPLRVVEWGCGCGRILRHLAQSGLDDARLAGFDVDLMAIEWNRQNLSGIEFRLSPAIPPLPVEDGAFDVVYHYSVWTHLPQAAAESWAQELARVLSPGGILIATTHGDTYRHMLLPGELRQYDAGEPVYRGNFPEGRKYSLSFHPPVWVESMLRQHFDRVVRLSPTVQMPQDLWVAIK